MNIKRVISGLLIGISICFGTLNFSIDSAAAGNALKNGTFTSLSFNEKEALITETIHEISRDLDIPYVHKVNVYEDPSSVLSASNTASEYAHRYSLICVNVAALVDPNEAAFYGISVEQNVVRVLAHEVRHSY